MLISFSYIYDDYCFVKRQFTTVYFSGKGQVYLGITRGNFIFVVVLRGNIPPVLVAQIAVCVKKAHTHRNQGRLHQRYRMAAILIQSKSK